MPVGDEDTAAELLAAAEQSGDPGPLARVRGSAAGDAALVLGADAAAARHARTPRVIRRALVVRHHHRVVALGCEFLQFISFVVGWKWNVGLWEGNSVETSELTVWKF